MSYISTDSRHVGMRRLPSSLLDRQSASRSRTECNTCNDCNSYELHPYELQNQHRLQSP
jgi:hypothetical protein